MATVQSIKQELEEISASFETFNSEVDQAKPRFQKVISQSDEVLTGSSTSVANNVRDRVQQAQRSLDRATEQVQQALNEIHNYTQGVV